MKKTDVRLICAETPKFWVAGTPSKNHHVLYFQQIETLEITPDETDMVSRYLKKLVDYTGKLEDLDVQLVGYWPNFWTIMKDSFQHKSSSGKHDFPSGVWNK